MHSSENYFSTVTIILGALAIATSIASFLLNLYELSEGKTEMRKARLKRSRIVLVYCALMLSLLTLVFESKNNFDKNKNELRVRNQDDSTRESHYKTTLSAIKHTIDSIDTVLIRQKKQMLDLTYLNKAQMQNLHRMEDLRIGMDAARQLSFACALELQDIHDLDTMFRFFSSDLLAMKEPEKFAFKELRSDDGISATRYVAAGLSQLNLQVARRITPEISIYVLPPNLKTHKFFSDTSGWARPGWGPKFEIDADEIIPSTWTLQGETTSKGSGIDYSEFSTMGEETTMTLTVSIDAIVKIKPASKTLPFSDLQNQNVIIRVSSNSSGWQCLYLKIINEQTKAYVMVDIKKHIATRQMDYVKDFAWGHCVENFYAAKISELVVNDPF